MYIYINIIMSFYSPKEEVIFNINSIKEIFLLIDKGIINQSKSIDSFIIFFYEVVGDIMSTVEKLNREESGQIKKIICIEVGKLIVKKHFPKFLHFYNDNIENIIEMNMKIYKNLKKEKKITKSLKKLKKFCIFLGFNCFKN